MANRATQTYVLLNGEVITSNGSSSQIEDVSKWLEGELLVVVSATGGTSPKLFVTYEEGREDDEEFHPHTFCPVIDADGNQPVVKLRNLGNNCRLSWKIAGSDTPTFTVSAYLVVKN